MSRVNKMTKVFIVGLVLLLVCPIGPRGALGDERPTNPGIGPNTVELLPYQGVSYRFQIIPLSTEPPVGFEQPNFDDSEFETGGAPFGGGGGGAPGGTDCPLHRTVQTQWPAESQLLVRHAVVIPDGATNLRIMVSVDNDIVGVFFNGRPLVEHTLGTTSVHHEGCPILDEFRFDVPPELVQNGSNLVAFHVVDRGAESFFDAKILTELAPDALSQALDRASSTVNLMIPIEPVSNITSMCNSFDGRNVATLSFLLDRSGETGQIQIEQSTEGESTMKYLLNGELMATLRQTRGDQGQFNIDIRPSPSASKRLGDVFDPASSAVNAVLARPSVQSDLNACFYSPIRPDPTLNCARNCEAIANQGREEATEEKLGDCFLTTGGGLIGGAWIGLRLGGVWGAFGGAIVGGGLCYLSNKGETRRHFNWNQWKIYCQMCCEEGCPTETCTSKQPGMTTKIATVTEQPMCQ